MWFTKGKDLDYTMEYNFKRVYRDFNDILSNFDVFVDLDYYCLTKDEPFTRGNNFDYVSFDEIYKKDALFEDMFLDRKKMLDELVIKDLHTSPNIFISDNLVVYSRTNRNYSEFLVFKPASKNTGIAEMQKMIIDLLKKGVIKYDII